MSVVISTLESVGDSIKNLAPLGGVGGRRYSCREIEVLFIKSSYLVYVGMIY